MKNANDVRNKIILGDCLEVLRDVESNTVTAVVSDPPYGLSAQPDMKEVLKHWLAGDDYEHKGGGFMGKDWDSFVPSPKIWAEVMRVLKPGGHILSFYGTRTYDLGVTAMRIAGAEVRDKMAYFCEMEPESGQSWVQGCLSDDTELLINGRWEPYHKAIAGKHTLCYDMDKDELKWAPIQEVFVYEYDDTAYRIQSGDTDQVVSRNHRCIIERNGKKEFRVAEELATSGQKTCVPIVENMQSLFKAFSLSNGNTDKNSQNMFEYLREKIDGSWCQEVESNVTEKGDDGDNLCCVQKDCLAASCLDKRKKFKKCQNPNMLKKMQRAFAGQRICEARIQGQSGMDGRECSVIQEENDRCEQSRMAGRGNVFQDAWKLCGGKIYSLSKRLFTDGSQRRVYNGTSTDCCEGYGKNIVKNGSGASCQSQSNGQSSGESGIIFHQCGTQKIRGGRYVKTTLARIEPFHYIGKVWCVRVPTGAFVARRNGKVFITGNSGFPKSLNIGKAIDKSAGRIGQDVTEIKLKLVALFDASGKSRKQIDEECGFRACNYLSYPTEEKRFDPWFTVLPSQEKWQKIKEVVGQGNPEIDNKLDEWFMEAEREIVGHQTKARKTDCGIALPTTGETEYQTWDVTAPATDEAKKWNGYGTALKPAHEPVACFGKSDEHGVMPQSLQSDAPFLYTPKVSTKERNLGCTHLFWKHNGNDFEKITEEEHIQLTEENEKRKGEEGFVPYRLSQGNIHPTVKPIELVRYLVKLVKMPGDNLILDPFIGSGTTAIACILEGCDCVGIDKDPVAFEIAKARAHYFMCLGKGGLKK